MPVLEVTLQTLRSSYGWDEVFGQGSGGITTNAVDECPPGSKVDRTPPSIEDVVEIIAAVNGENDEEEWLGVFRLADGRYLVASGSCDYSGWD